MKASDLIIVVLSIMTWSMVFQLCWAMFVPPRK